MGAESSRLGVIWSVLDDDKDGYITAAELEEWFRDEAFLDNRLFSPHHNGVTSIHALALSFLHSVDRDRDSKVSYEDLKAYTEGMKEEEITDLAQSLVEVNQDKKKKACKKVFTAIDTNNQSDTRTHTHHHTHITTQRIHLSLSSPHPVCCAVCTAGIGVWRMPSASFAMRCSTRSASHTHPLHLPLLIPHSLSADVLLWRCWLCRCRGELRPSSASTACGTCALGSFRLSLPHRRSVMLPPAPLPLLQW